MMPDLYGKSLTRQELLKRVGHLAQIGGVQLLRFEDGPAGGVHILEFRLGSGLVFKVALERGMDVGYCEYKGIPLGWIPPTLLPAPWYFEQQTEFGWLRTAMGGFCTSCGMLHIGNPESDSVAQYHFSARLEERYGVHDRMAMLPARLGAYGETWEGERCVLSAEGQIIQAQVYGENLVLRRRYQALLGEKRYFMHDEITNEGCYPTPLMLLYHINLGFPLVDEGAELVSSLVRPPSLLAGDEAHIRKDSYCHFDAPQAGRELQVFDLTLPDASKDVGGVAVVNRRLGNGGLGVYLRYRRSQFPHFLETCSMDERHYFVSLEPCTNDFGRAELRRRGELPVLQPNEKRCFDLEVGVLEGESEINIFCEGL
jgi:hypothetical protein